MTRVKSRTRGKWKKIDPLVEARGETIRRGLKVGDLSRGGGEGGRQLGQARGRVPEWVDKERKGRSWASFEEGGGGGPR